MRGEKSLLRCIHSRFDPHVHGEPADASSAYLYLTTIRQVVLGWFLIYHSLDTPRGCSLPNDGSQPFALGIRKCRFSTFHRLVGEEVQGQKGRSDSLTLFPGSVSQLAVARTRKDTYQLVVTIGVLARNTA